MSESLRALRRANPRGTEGFENSVVAAAAAVRARIATAVTAAPAGVQPARRRRLVPVSVGGGAFVVAAAVAVFLTLASSGRGPGVESAAAAMRKAVGVSAASAEQSGTAVVRITHDGEHWGGRTIRWHDEDLAVSSEDPGRHGRAGSEMRLVGGMMYGVDERDGGWVELGRPDSIDPGSGTTPAEYLAAVREDVGGETLRRITGAMTRPSTRRLDDGSTVYSGSVAAGLIARETGFKGGRPIRVLPFGYVAHDEAADPAERLDVAVTVGADSVVRGIALSWGTSSSAWTYTVDYSGLGVTRAPVAPADAKPLRER